MAMRSDGEDKNTVQDTKPSETEVKEDPAQGAQSQESPVDEEAYEDGRGSNVEGSEQGKVKEEPKKSSRKTRKTEKKPPTGFVAAEALRFVAFKKLETYDFAEFASKFDNMSLDYFVIAYRFLYAKALESTDEQQLAEQVRKTDTLEVAKRFVDRLARLLMDSADWQDYTEIFGEEDRD